MPLDRSELAQRISLTGPKDLVRGSVFHALLDEVGQHAPGDVAMPRLVSRWGPQALQELHFYPAAEWLELYWDAMDVAEGPCGGVEAAAKRLGEAACRRFLGSLIGRLAVEAGASKPPLERLLAMPAGYAAATSYGLRAAERLDERRGVLRYEREFAPPAFHAAVAHKVLRYGGHRVQVRPVVNGLLEFELHVECTAA
ncbi:MAG: DUF2378 family protein [Deltaproteobacteria bacterium]|nr:DUF2378 family protein [Deltaproteobacteria bacterium]